MKGEQVDMKSEDRLLVIFEGMFIRGGRNDSIVSFIFGQVTLLLISFMFAKVFLLWFFSSGSSISGSLGFLTVFSETNFLLFLIFLIWSHEMGHLQVFFRHGAAVFGLVLPPFGGIMVPDRELSEKKNIEVALAGPITGYAAVPMLFFGLQPSESIWIGAAVLWAGVNALNLLPLYPLDGGWVVKEVLKAWVSDKWARRISWGFTLSFVGLLYFIVPQKAVLALQLIIVTMLLVVDFAASKVFRWFSKQHLDNDTEGQKEKITPKQAKRMLVIYIVNFAALVTFTLVAYSLLPYNR